MKETNVTPLQGTGETNDSLEDDGIDAWNNPDNQALVAERCTQMYHLDVQIDGLKAERKEARHKVKAAASSSAPWMRHTRHWRRQHFAGRGATRQAR